MASGEGVQCSRGPQRSVHLTPGRRPAHPGPTSRMVRLNLRLVASRQRGGGCHVTRVICRAPFEVCEPGRAGFRMRTSRRELRKAPDPCSAGPAAGHALCCKKDSHTHRVHGCPHAGSAAGLGNMTGVLALLRKSLVRGEDWSKVQQCGVCSISYTVHCSCSCARCMGSRARSCAPGLGTPMPGAVHPWAGDPHNAPPSLHAPPLLQNDLLDTILYLRCISAIIAGTAFGCLGYEGFYICLGYEPLPRARGPVAWACSSERARVPCECRAHSPCTLAGVQICWLQLQLSTHLAELPRVRACVCFGWGGLWVGWAGGGTGVGRSVLVACADACQIPG